MKRTCEYCRGSGYLPYNPPDLHIKRCWRCKGKGVVKNDKGRTTKSANRSTF